MRRLLLWTVFSALVLAFVAADLAVAADGSISIVQIGCRVGHDTLVTGGRPRFVLQYTNNTGEKVDITNGFRVWSPDAAVWDSVTIDTIGYDFSGHSPLSGYFDIAFALMQPIWYRGTDTVGILASGTQINPLKQLPVGFSDTVLAISVYCPPYGNVNDGKHMCIDSSFFQPGGTWCWVGQSLTLHYPTFQAPTGIPYIPGAGYCFLLYNPPCLTTSGSTVQTTDPAGVDCVSCQSKCCRGYTGNVNMLGIVDSADLAGLVAYLTGGGYTLPCVQEANIDASGIVDSADLAALVSYLTGGGYTLPVCGI